MTHPARRLQIARPYCPRWMASFSFAANFEEYYTYQCILTRVIKMQ